MKSKTRQSCEDAIQKFANHINNTTQGGEMLFCGIGGDTHPDGEYAYMFNNYKSTTIDICECYNPKIVGDITNTNLNPNSWDLVILVQTLEHIENIFDVGPEVHRILRPGGYFIVDCPFNYPYHPEPGFRDLWRVTQDGMNALFGKHFELVGLEFNDHNTSCLYRKTL